MTLIRNVALAIIAFIVAGFLLVFVIDRHDKSIIEQVLAKQEVAANDSVERQLSPQSTALGIQYRELKVPYVVYRDRVIHDNPTDTALKTLAGRCDQLIVTCEQRHVIDSQRIANQADEISTLKKMKAQKPSRASAFLSAGYDWYNGKPLGQIGGDLRVAGPMSITGWLDASRGTKEEKIATRGVVALKFTFR